MSLDEDSNILFLHDFDLNKIKDAPYVLKQLAIQKKSSIGVKFPPQISSEEDFEKWRKVPLDPVLFCL